MDAGRAGSVQPVAIFRTLLTRPRIHLVTACLRKDRTAIHFQLQTAARSSAKYRLGDPVDLARLPPIPSFQNRCGRYKPSILYEDEFPELKNGNRIQERCPACPTKTSWTFSSVERRSGRKRRKWPRSPGDRVKTPTTEGQHSHSGSRDSSTLVRKLRFPKTIPFVVLSPHRPTISATCAPGPVRRELYGSDSPA